MRHYDERGRVAQHRIGVGLALVAGAAVAGTLALTATSPAASADTIELPVYPIGDPPLTDQETLGVAPSLVQAETFCFQFLSLGTC